MALKAVGPITTISCVSRHLHVAIISFSSVDIDKQRGKTLEKFEIALTPLYTGS
jgi:hypothetical protein